MSNRSEGPPREAGTPVQTTTSGDGGTDDLTGLSATGRYVRLLGTHRATKFGYSLRELEIFVN
jgi:hypothetical protein